MERELYEHEYIGSIHLVQLLALYLLAFFTRDYFKTAFLCLTLTFFEGHAGFGEMEWSPVTDVREQFELLDEMREKSKVEVRIY